MRILFKQGISINKISKMFPISYHTAYYWIKSDYRKRKQLKNAKRVYSSEEQHARIKTIIAKRKLLRNTFVEDRFKHRFHSQKNEKRDKFKGCKIYGLTFKEAEKLNNKLKIKTNQKIN